MDCDTTHLTTSNKIFYFLIGNIHKYGEIKTSIVFDKLDISNKEDFCHRLYIFLL